MLVQQAVFTSARTSRLDGYQIVGASSLLSDEDLRELATWGPSHDSLLETGPGAGSINFHPLPSGNYCVSKTSLSGAEYSGRAGERVYTQCLVVSPELLLRMANNPFRLLEAATAAGHTRIHAQVPPVLPPLELPGRASPVDRVQIGWLVHELGPARVAQLADLAMRGEVVGLLSPLCSKKLMAALINLLPVENRTAYSFSTGLRCSPRRPFRLVALPSDRVDLRRAVRQWDVTICDLTQTDGLPERFDGWAGEVHGTLLRGGVAALCELIKQAPLREASRRLQTQAAAGDAAANASPGTLPYQPPPYKTLAAQHAEPAHAGRTFARDAEEELTPAAVRRLLDRATLDGDAAHSAVATLAARATDSHGASLEPLVQAATGTTQASGENPRLADVREQTLQRILARWREAPSNKKVELALWAVELLSLLYDDSRR